MSESGSPLVLRMRMYANEHPECAEEFTSLADAIDAACEAEPWDFKAVVRAWARARRRWCEVTGEPLV